MITQAYLKEMLSYDPTTGLFHWVKKPSRRTVVGAQAGCVAQDGYILIRLNKVSYRASRLAWLYVHGEMPDLIVDHINRNRADNRIKNLRLATPRESTLNCGNYSNNTSGFKGVSKRILETGRVRWLARSRLNGKLKVIGSYDSPKEAGAAYVNFVKENHGEFCSYV
jgi:hypothetical protein